MSVINQMLKDLDKRNNDVDTRSEHGPVFVSQSNNKSITLAIILSVIVTLAIVVSYFLYIENQSLKSALILEKTIDKLPQTDIDASKRSRQQIKQPSVLTSSSIVRNQTVEAVSVHKSSRETVAEKNSQILPNTSSSSELETTATKSNLPKRVIVEPINNQNEVATDAVNDMVATKQQVVSEQKKRPETIANKPITTQPLNVEKPAKLVIARKQLTTEELVAQKMQRAEKAILDKQLDQAETLFQDILLLMPTHQIARKQLAALWFGEKSYQPALNLLKQGVELSPNNSDFRLMQAKIYLSQQQYQLAYQILIPLADIANVEYQSLLATISQRLKHHESAVKAYQQLLITQPKKAKWQLGLAIALDSNSQFEQAIIAYQKALNLGDLSISSRNFIQERLQALGES